VQIWGTGGMSHQLQGPRAGLINREWDNAWLDKLMSDPPPPRTCPHRLRARSRLGRHRAGDVADRPRRHGRRGRWPGPRVAHRFYHVPASNTAVGHLILENT
jgi:protocatechuate 4,5-dioxygenase beta chain